MEQIAFKNIRAHFTEIANKVQYAKERYVLTKNNRPALAMISIEDLNLLNELIEKFEDHEDLKKYEERKHEKSYLLNELWQELNINL